LPIAFHGSQVAEHYSWENIAIVIPLGTTDMWVDESMTPAAPFVQNTVIEIQGQVEAVANESFYQVILSNVDVFIHGQHIFHKR
jgi:hypothetical protein